MGLILLFSSSFIIQFDFGKHSIIYEKFVFYTYILVASTNLYILL